MKDKTQGVKSLVEFKKVIVEFGDRINGFVEELSKLLNDIEIPDEEEDTWEMKCPYKDGDKTWVIYSYGDVDSSFWFHSSEDNARFKSGNIFTTKQAAELEAKRRKLLTRFRAFRDECNGDWKPVSGKQCKTSKFLIGYSWDSKDEQYKLKSLELGSSDLFHQFGYFKNQEDCKRAIDLFGDEIKELFVEGDA